MKRVVFILDRVTHYHKELLQTLEAELYTINIELYLLAGQSLTKDLARTRVEGKVIKNEVHFEQSELKVKSLTFRYQKNITTLISNIKPDVVILQSHVGNVSTWALMKLKKALNFKLVAWQCGYEYNPSKIKDYLLKKFIKNFDYHLAYHTNAKNYALFYGAKKEQITVIHNTINETLISLTDKRKARAVLNKRLSVDIINKKVILYVGAILEEKNLLQLCQSLRHTSIENAILIVVGDGPYLDELKEQFSFDDNIVFVGSVLKEVGLYFDSADVFVLPGTGGLAINEAMAHGLPIISGYADGSADDLVINNVNGLRLTQSTPEEITNQIITLLSSPEALSLMGEKSKDMIQTHFTYERFIDRIVGVIKKLI